MGKSKSAPTSSAPAVGGWRFSALQIGAAVGAVGFFVGSRIIDLSWLLPNNATVQTITGLAVGVPAGWLAYEFAREGEKKDNYRTDPTVNETLVDQGVRFMVEEPLWFGVITLGYATLLNIAYQYFLDTGVRAVYQIIPILSPEKIPLAIVAISGGAAILFGGFAYWTIEVFIWAGKGGSYADNNPIPQKPGGRSVWGLQKLPKDAFFFLFAMPHAIIDGIEAAIKNKSALPVLFIPFTAIHQQFIRLGDVVIDMMTPPLDLEKDAKKLLVKAGKGFKKFEELAESNVPGARTLMHDLGHKDTPADWHSHPASSADPTYDPFATHYDQPNKSSTYDTFTMDQSEPTPYNYPTMQGTAFGVPINGVAPSEENRTGHVWALYPQHFLPGDNDLGF